METLNQIFSILAKSGAVLLLIGFALAALWTVYFLLLRKQSGLGEEQRFRRRIVMLVLTGLVIVAIVVLLAFQMDEAARGQLFGVLGLLLTAVIALSSTTFVANAMAGLMLRAVRSFKPGDFVRVGEKFGRVTDRGWFHTEIQTEDRDLATIPNLYLVSNPITVIRATGTIVSATVSLGYENPHALIESLLIQAAQDAQLTDPFVQIMELGDFSVAYRVAGFLPEVKQILTARSNIRKMVLDRLHGADIEIVSPAFMNQRQLREQTPVLPPQPTLRSVLPSPVEDLIPEEMIFDKAEKIEKLEQLRALHEKLTGEIKELQARRKGADEREKSELAAEVSKRQTHLDKIARVLDDAAARKDQ